MAHRRRNHATCTIILLSILIASASSIHCTPVDSWATFKQIITDATSSSSTTTSSSPPSVVLCPFSIQKTHGTRTDHWKEMLILDSPIQIQCYKKQPSDQCKITSVGPRCSRRLRCQHVMEIRTDDVTLQGLTFVGAQAGSLVIQSHSRGVRLVDMEYDGNASPNEKEGSIIEVKSGTSTSIIDSRFYNNQGTAVENKGGTMMVLSSTFIGNEATPTWDSNDAENQGGGTGGAIINNPGSTLFLSESIFVQNTAEQSGPAVFTNDARTLDTGGNCGRENQVLDGSICNGIYDQQSDSCASFGSLCGDDVNLSGQ